MQKLSRSKIELFVDCPCCFYLDRRLGVKRPASFPFNLNLAVDQLLKNEFDLYRVEQKPHPLMELFNLDAIPFSHPNIDIWRENFKGIEFLHQDTDFLITGAIDDLWQTPEGKLLIVDYKATSKSAKINRTSDIYSPYKRQMEIYQWLFTKNEFEVDSKGYFVYCNGIKNKPRFDRHLEFDVNIIPYTGNIDWIEPTLFDIYECIHQNKVPEPKKDCSYCKYATDAKPYIK
ncbi:MAG: PD-(D/E)XK nuclease family protein [Rhabdochlamydiaceae bacterium]|nr:PD-(D/E)XK nuclease family protein [Candidatus Amphrikana amoebophyrae]